MEQRAMIRKRMGGNGRGILLRTLRVSTPNLPPSQIFVFMFIPVFLFLSLLIFLSSLVPRTAPRNPGLTTESRVPPTRNGVPIAAKSRALTHDSPPLPPQRGSVKHPEQPALQRSILLTNLTFFPPQRSICLTKLTLLSPQRWFRVSLLSSQRQQQSIRVALLSPQRPRRSIRVSLLSPQRLRQSIRVALLTPQRKLRSVGLGKLVPPKDSERLLRKYA